VILLQPFSHPVYELQALGFKVRGKYSIAHTQLSSQKKLQFNLPITCIGEEVLHIYRMFYVDDSLLITKPDFISLSIHAILN